MIEAVTIGLVLSAVLTCIMYSIDHASRHDDEDSTEE